jgi:CBS domain-containing protein
MGQFSTLLHGVEPDTARRFLGEDPLRCSQEHGIRMEKYPVPISQPRIGGLYLKTIPAIDFNNNQFIPSQEKIMKKCDEVMTQNPVCCLPNDTAAKAAQLMKSENVGSIPIVESEQTKKLVGIVTDRDLTLKVVAEGLDGKYTKVESVMTPEVVTCHADDDVQKALDAMAEHQLRRVVVVDQDQKVVGIIAQADVATRVDQAEKTAEVVKEISQSTEE